MIVLACNCVVFYLFLQTEFKTSLVKFKWDSPNIEWQFVFLMSDCWFQWKSLNIECWTKYNEWHQNKTFIVSFHLPIVPLILHCFFNTEFEYWGFSCLYHSNHFYRFLTKWSDLPISTVHLRYLYFCISTKFSLVSYSLTWACWGSCVFLQRFPHTNTFLVIL